MALSRSKDKRIKLFFSNYGKKQDLDVKNNWNCKKEMQNIDISRKQQGE